MKLYGYELPSPFSKFIGALTAPPRRASIENRPAADMIAAPTIMFYDPASLHYREAMRPTVPGNPNVTAGLGMIQYDHQAMWDRNAVCEAGPVRQFFHDMMEDNRVKRTG